MKSPNNRSPSKDYTSGNCLHLIELAKMTPWGFSKHPRLLPGLLHVLHKLKIRPYCRRLYLNNSLNMKMLNWCLTRTFIPSDMCPQYQELLCMLPKAKVHINPARNISIHNSDLHASGTHTILDSFIDTVQVVMNLKLDRPVTQKKIQYYCSAKGAAKLLLIIFCCTHRSVYFSASFKEAFSCNRLE